MVEALALELNSVIAGTKTVEEALNTSAKEIDSILTEAGYK